jgi:hypothetical protein
MGVNTVLPPHDVSDKRCDGNIPDVHAEYRHFNFVTCAHILFKNPRSASGKQRQAQTRQGRPVVAPVSLPQCRSNDEHRRR